MKKERKFITLAQVRDWLKDILKEPAKPDYFYIGKLDSKKEKSIGVYQLQNRNDFLMNVGGEEYTRALTKGISLLIHYNKNADETENFALEVYKTLMRQEEAEIGGVGVDYIEFLHAEPIDVACDENGIYERVIEFIIHYRNI